MTEFNPGPGWHKVPYYVNSTDRPKQRCIIVYGPGKHTVESTWLEDLPLELPTIAGAYIRVAWKDHANYNYGANTFVLATNGTWVRVESGTPWEAHTLLARITSYETLYVPAM